jgi:DNA-binding LacI/PurR family transcriptional regulator
LTTIRQPLFEMAETAAEMVLDMADGIAPAQSRMELATELILRESTASPATTLPREATLVPVQRQKDSG